MAIDQKVTVGSIFVLAYTCFNNRSVFQTRQATREVSPHFYKTVIRYKAIIVVGIEWRAMSIDCYFDAAVFQIGKTIGFLFEVDPNGQLRRQITVSVFRGTKEEHFLTTWNDPITQYL